MRDWQLGATDPLALRLAADVRLFRTDYTDDQIWELRVGQGQAPPLALETRYGGRCGLARLVPIWVVDGRPIHEAAGFAGQPLLRVFWPSYLRFTARPVSHLALQAEYWAIESHVVGGRFTFVNEGQQPTQVGVDLLAQVMTEMREHEIGLLTFGSRRRALHVRDVGNLQPVVLLENALADAEQPHLSTRLTIPPGERAVVRWVHAARPGLTESLALARYWLEKQDWDTHLARLREINATTPEIATGDAGRDAAIAFSYKVLLQSFVGPTGRLPYPSFVFARIPARGFSPRGDGSDHNWQWNGQVATEAYMALPAIAPVAPELAKGALRNYLATQGADGFIDWKPGLGGQRHGQLSIPLLAYTAWLVYFYTEDRDFLAEVFPGLLRFFHRWFQRDVDRDGDGLPEWTDTIQSAFDDNPSFVPYRRWAQNADISKAETPDLAAYLIWEARSLLNMAQVLDREQEQSAVQQRLDVLRAHLATMWSDATGSYHYRDRDSHITTTGVLVAEGPGDSSLLPALDLNPPNRLIVRVLGGRDHRPAMAILLEGLAADGKAVAETLPAEAFSWYRGMGAATSAHLYRRIDRITATGLSRVYAVQVSSVDWTRQDQTLLLPLWACPDDAVRIESLVKTITDPERYWRPYGIPNCSAQDPAYDPTNRDGSGGVWMMWNQMLGEGLIDAGRPDLAAELLQRIMVVQLHTLCTQKAFREAYNSDALEGIGEIDYLWGVVPLHLLWRLMGVRIVSPRRVWIGGKYALPWPVTIRHLGVEVRRDEDGAIVVFPSGHRKRLRGEKWRVVEDTTAFVDDAAPVVSPLPPEPPTPGRAKTVKIKVTDGDTSPET